MPGFPRYQHVVYAGNLALVQETLREDEGREGRLDSVPTLSLELKSCKVRWVAPMCRFQGDLDVSGTPGEEVGVGICPIPRPPDSAPRKTNHDILDLLNRMTRQAVAIDLRTGKRRWALVTGVGVGVLAADAEAVYVTVPSGYGRSGPTDLLVLDPRTGAVKRTLNVPEEQPRSLHILPGGSQALLMGRALSALRLSDGEVLWRKSLPPPGRLPDETRQEIHGRRLFLFEESGIREFDALTGAEQALHVLPVPHHGDRPPRLLPGPGPENLLVLFSRKDGPGVAARYSRRGSPPTLATLSGHAAGVLSARDGAYILHRLERGKDWMEGYSGFETLPPESELSGPVRVRAMLDRNPWNLRMRYGDQSARIAELRSIPGADTLLAAFAGDTSLPHHQDALLAATAMRVPGLASLLRAEVARPLHLPDTAILNPPKLKPKPPEEKPRRRSRFNNVMPMIPSDHFRPTRIRDDFASILRRRGYYITTLAALDDTAAVGLLAPMLFADRSPTGFGREDWEHWGYYTENGFGRKSWPAGWNTEGGFSGCLQGPAGRPQVHADVYRMLARLGRPSDRAILDRFDSAIAPAGWANLCAADDALPRPKIDASIWPYGSGMCLGLDAGPYRVAQVGSLWLRRRGRNGSWGPPAWAHDPGGDLILERSKLRKIRFTGDGMLALEGSSLGEMEVERSWNVILDPGRVFADADRDGMSDGTEKVFGTDPARADTDGDGIPDGRDPAPRAGPARTEEGRVAEEAVHFLTRFLIGGPVSLYADRKYWGGGGTAGAGLVLHRERRDDRLPDCMSPAFCADGLTEETRARSPRRCESILAIDTIQIGENQAEGDLTWELGRDRRYTCRLELAKVGGRWRITEARLTSI